MVLVEVVVKVEGTVEGGVMGVDTVVEVMVAVEVRVGSEGALKMEAVVVAGMIVEAAAGMIVEEAVEGGVKIVAVDAVATNFYCFSQLFVR